MVNKCSSAQIFKNAVSACPQEVTMKNDEKYIDKYTNILYTYSYECQF